MWRVVYAVTLLLTYCSYTVVFASASIRAHVLCSSPSRQCECASDSRGLHPSASTHALCILLHRPQTQRERERKRGREKETVWERQRTPRNGNLRHASSVRANGNFDDLTVKPMETWRWCSSPWWWIRLSACPAILSLCSSPNRLQIHFSSQILLLYYSFCDSAWRTVKETGRIVSIVIIIKDFQFIQIRDDCNIPLLIPL